MRAVIASRIYAPEPSAASFRLEALAKAFASRGIDVEVLTTTYPGALDTNEGRITVRRSRVFRDKAGYVRGYAQYLSFDIPLFFRLLMCKRPDVVICEPPPTTGIVVRVTCALRRIPYVAYAPDLWSDAMESMQVPGVIRAGVRALERSVYAGAKLALSVLPEISHRLEKWMPTSRIATVGNGIDTAEYSANGHAHSMDNAYLLYAGTASEFQGASIFVEAFALVAKQRKGISLVFLGQGSEFEEIRERAQEIGAGRVAVLDRVPAAEAAQWLRGATATLVSIKPGLGYEFALPTKIYASVACGTPVIFAGEGAGRELVEENNLGWAADYEPHAIATSMLAAVDARSAASNRAKLADWARENASLDRVGNRAVDAIVDVLG
jgi:glycosyltransferase involved in cell wall biosynthesis